MIPFSNVYWNVLLIGAHILLSLQGCAKIKVFNIRGKKVCVFRQNIVEQYSNVSRWAVYEVVSLG